jgi:spherulation-specific family 4 protein
MQVIHNPGTPPDAEMAEPGPDVIITCEESYDNFKGYEVQKRLKDLHYDRERSGYMISGIPTEEIGQAVKELATRGTYIFATDLVEDFYESFGISWVAFITAVEEAAGAAPVTSEATEIVHDG